MSITERFLKIKKSDLLTSSALLLTAAWSNATFAQATSGAAETKLEEVVVTAERRENDMQKTATSVSVRGGEELLQQGRFSTRQILEDVVGLDLSDSTGMFSTGADAVGNNISIRGVKSNEALSNLAGVPATAVYVDGVYEGVGSGYDLDRVEVLRGPQGTLYGRSATAGVVAFHTRNPSFDRLAGDTTVEFGTYSLRHYTGTINVPISDVFAMRVAVNKYAHDSYYGDLSSERENLGGRIKLLYRPNENFSILVGAAFDDNETRSGGAAGDMVIPEKFHYTPVSVVLPADNSFKQYWAEVNWNLGASTLTYQPAFRSWEQDDLHYVSGLGGLIQSLQTPFDEYITHELRLASNPGSKLTWVVGAFYYDNHVRNSNTITFQSSGNLLLDSRAQRTTQDEGLFGELTYPFTDATRLTVGARYDETEVHTDQYYAPQGFPAVNLTGPEGTRRFYNTNYKVRFEQELTSSNLLYAMISTGFLPGDVQVNTGLTSAEIQPYSSETLTAYEIGSKNRFLDDSLQVNGSIYYYRYGAFQTSVFADPNNPGSAFIASVPARMRGGELELLYQLTPRDRLGLTYAYTDAYFTNQPADFSAVVSASAEKVPGVTPHTVTASYDHVFELPSDSTLVLHADGRFLSAHDIYLLTNNITGLEPYARVDDAVIGNASGTWNFGNSRFSITGYVRNVGDKRYPTRITNVQTVGSPAVVTRVVGVQSDPRTLGMVFSAHF